MRDFGGSQKKMLDVGFDNYGRPQIVLVGEPGTSHTIILESLRPTVTGFCVTCFEANLDHRRCAARKARSCPQMVGYLSWLNRDRAMRHRLFQELDRVRQLESLLVS